MPKITVAVEVPPGDYCEVCLFQAHIVEERRHFCLLFEKNLKGLYGPGMEGLNKYLIKCARCRRLSREAE